jgi:carboxyl-terminal processing protease
VSRAALLVAVGLVAALGGCGPGRGTIGAVLVQDGEQRLYVREVPPGLGADRAGVRAGDEILMIDGLDARSMGDRGVHQALSGNVGEPVKLTLVRDGQIVRVTVRRSLSRKHRVPAPSASQR